MSDEPSSLYQITATKVNLPGSRPNLLSRQRLLNLFQNLLDHKLITVAAPAGYGKTSLLVDVAAQFKTPVCWYTVDSLDNDPQRFVAHFIASIAQCFPDFGVESAQALRNTSEPIDQDYLLSTIINDAYKNISEHFMLVLDDYHHITNHKIDLFLDRFVQMIDENCHLVVVSRTILRLPALVLLVGRSQVGGIGLKELAFQPDEIQALILQNYNLYISQDVAAELARETEGWITGLLLSAQSRWADMIDQLRLAKVSGVRVYDYLAQQVFELQPPPIQDFLLRTSLLDEFNAELCAAVFGAPENAGDQTWQDLIDTVVQNNLFVLCMEDEDGVWIRYHNLFQDFLKEKFEAQNPGEVLHVYRELANIYADNGQWEKARDLYLHLSDIPAMVNLLEQVGASLMYAGRLHTVTEWLNTVPEEMINLWPALLSLRGIVAVMKGEIEEGMVFLNQAETTSLAEDNIPVLAQTLTRRATAHKFLANYQASIADADEAFNLVETNEELQFIKAEALRAKGAGYYHLGQLNEAVEFWQQSLELFTVLNQFQNVGVLSMELGIAYTELGLYKKALACYNNALGYWQQVKNILWLAHLHNSMGVLHYLTGHYDLAETNLDVAIKFARESGYTRIEALALAGIGDIYVALNAPSAALQAYQQAGRHADKFFLPIYLSIARAGLARQVNDFPQAKNLLLSAQTLAAASRSNYEQALCAFEAGQLALAQHNYQQAADNFNTAIEYFSHSGQKVNEIRARLLLAQVCLATQTKHDARTQLQKTFSAAAKLENRHPLVRAGQGCRQFLQKFKKDAVVGYQVGELLQNIDQFERKIPTLRHRLRKQAAVIPFAPPKLSVNAFGVPRVMLDGQLVTSTDWQTQRRVREFFFYLLANQNNPTRSSIGVVFWPESSPDKLKKQFKNTIYKLRRALDKDFVLFDSIRDSYSFNRQLDYEYDVEIFEQHINQANCAPTIDEQIKAYTNAIHLYQGDYLVDMDGTWILAERERLTQIFIRTSLKLIELHFQIKNYDSVLTLCRQTLQIDPCQEVAHRQAMRAYAAQGNRANIIRQYELCKDALREEVNAPVSAQTLKLYQSLTA